MQATDLNNTESQNILEASMNTPKQAPLTYIRAARGGEGEGFAVCSENGEVLACFATHEAAFYTARQFRLEPLLVH